MANLTRWAAGNLWGLSSWTSLATASLFNSLANGSCLSTAQIDNTSALDIYADISFAAHPGTTTVAASYLSLFLLPLNQDGTTYGDGSIGTNTTSANSPASQYQAGALNCYAGGITTSGFVVGSFTGVLLPPEKFILVLQNNLGNALNSAAAGVLSGKSYVENLNG